MHVYDIVLHCPVSAQWWIYDDEVDFNREINPPANEELVLFISWRDNDRELEHSRHV